MNTHVVLQKPLDDTIDSEILKTKEEGFVPTTSFSVPVLLSANFHCVLKSSGVVEFNVLKSPDVVEHV